nr:MAG TPA: hypothetical protein [Caudoviricetes sp.]
MNRLYIALMEKGIKPDEASKFIASIIGCTERTARNKLKSVTEFTVSEAIKINEKAFSNSYEIGYLFKNNHEEKKGA